MPDLKKMLTLEALSEALPSWLKRSTKPEYNADEIDSTLTTNQFVSASDKDNWNAKGTYSKPSGGIPKSDLSSIVQTSLEKADSALQSETDPTVPSWAKQSSKPSYTQDEVSDGTTFKRVTQTEKDAWSGKQNALTTTQMQAVNSGITAAGVTQISTNQANIMYAIDAGVKNRLNYNAWKTVGVAGGQAVFENNGVTLTATGGDCYTLQSAASFPVDARIYVTEGEVIVLSWDYEKAASANGYAYIFPEGNASGSKLAEVSARKIEYTVPANVSYITFRVGVNSGSGHVIKYKDIMICEKVFYDEDQSFLPSALTNYDLTRLESEDRASLAEVVDSGAKNVLDFANVVYANSNEANYSKTDTSITVTNKSTGGGYGYVSYSCSLDVGTYVMSCKITNATIASGTNGIFRIAGGTSGSPSIGNSNITGNGTYHNTFTITTKGTYYLVFGAEWNGTTGNSNTITASDIMICTLADWNVSHKYVPYRHPNNNLGYKTYEINLSAVTINKAGSGVYWYKISVSSDFSKVVSVSLTDGKEIPNKRSFMPYLENGTGGAQAIGFLIADPDAPATMTFNNGAYMSLTAFGYLK